MDFSVQEGAAIFVIALCAVSMTGGGQFGLNFEGLAMLYIRCSRIANGAYAICRLHRMAEA